MSRITILDRTFMSSNAITLAIGYTAFGALLSYIMYHLFDEFDEDWKKRTIVFQLADVSVEIGILATVSFWSSQFIQYLPPMLPVRKQLDTMVDSYISGIFFIFAIFIFLESLTEKLKYLFHTILEPYFNRIFPKYGSIIDLSLSYTPKTEQKKTS